MSEPAGNSAHIPNLELSIQGHAIAGGSNPGCVPAVSRITMKVLETYHFDAVLSRENVFIK